MSSNLTDELRTEATTYGELAFKNQLLRTKNEDLEVSIAEKEEKAVKAEENLERLEGVEQEIIRVKNEEKNRNDERSIELDTREKDIEEGKIALAKEIDEHLKEVSQYHQVKKEHAVSVNALITEKDALNIKELELNKGQKTVKDAVSAVETAATVLIEREKAVHGKEANVDGREKELIKNIESLKTKEKSIVSMRNGNKIEIEKLEAHHEKIRIDANRNEKFKKSIDERLPRLERLVKAGREIKEYATKYSKNHEGIAKKVEEVMDNLLSSNK